MNRQGRRHAPKTLMEQFTRAHGWRRGHYGPTFVVMWGTYRAATKLDEFTVDQVADWWGFSRAQMFRYQAAFREVYGPKSTPAVVLDSPVNVAFLRRVEDLGRALKAFDKEERVERIEASAIDLGWMAVAT